MTYEIGFYILLTLIVVVIMMTFSFFHTLGGKGRTPFVLYPFKIILLYITGYYKKRR